MSRRRKNGRMQRMIHAAAVDKGKLICMMADVEIKAADGEGESKGPPSFSVVAYTGGSMTLRGWGLPVVVDLKGMSFAKSLVANLDHEQSKRVGNVTGKEKTVDSLILSGIASAATDAAREVVESAKQGFIWQASIEASPDVLIEVAAGKTVKVNGQEFTGPLFVASKSTLNGFAFVSHGADDNTTVTIAATADDKSKEKTVDEELKKWIEAMGFDVAELSATQIDNLTADYEGRQGTRKPETTTDLQSGIEARKAETKRRNDITEHALDLCERRPNDIEAIQRIAQEAIEGKQSFLEYRVAIMDASVPEPSSPFQQRSRDRGLTNRVLEAAVCQHGRLPDLEKRFDDQTLQAAHDRFPQGIGLNQLILLGAEANGHRSQYASQVTIDAQRAAFGMAAPNQIRAAGFSTISIPTILSNVANKFLMMGWNSVDMTFLRIASVRSVRDFKTITTVSLTGDLIFKQVGPGGEIQHGTLGEETYSNKADTYARMLAITRADYINDDLGALTDTPRKLGRGGALKLNDIGWAKFLNNSAFFTSGRNNVNTAIADMTVGGLAATETIFMDQTDPDGNPLGTMPAILLVPTPLKPAALTLMNSELLIDGTGTGTQGSTNIWRGRFRVESSPYLSNANYTGYSAAAWYMLADPSEMPVIEVAALNGRVEPVVETADADFNVLGAQMRGYSDVGVELQEYRGGVRADGGSS